MISNSSSRSKKKARQENANSDRRPVDQPSRSWRCLEKGDCMSKPTRMQRPGAAVNGAINGGEENAVSVFRIDEGSCCFVRLLSEQYVGCFTHYYRGASRYCAGKECRDVMHKSTDKTWKGYAAVEIHEAGTTWVPFVLELSECLELDMRGRFRRGQVWKILRDQGDGRKPMPMRGILHEDRDPDSFPPAFDIRPVILRLYHVEKIDLSVKNPMPPRIVLGKSQDAPPAPEKAAASPEWKLTPAEQRLLDESRATKTGRAGMAVNGKQESTP